VVVEFRRMTIRVLRRYKMSKKLILGLALAVVLFSGSLFSAQAEKRDLDRSEATCQGAYNFGPTAPSIMGAPGAY
jgi:hypothetical protein